MLLRRLFILHYVQRTHQTITSSIRLPSFVYHIIAIMFTFLFTVRPPWYLKYHIFLKKGLLKVIFAYACDGILHIIA